MDFINTIDHKLLFYLEHDSKEYSVCQGLNKQVLTDSTGCTSQMLPITLFPTFFPKQHYNLVVNIQQEINSVMHKIAYDDNFLLNSLQEVLSVDDFTKTLFDIYIDVLKTGRSQTNSLGLFRSDYMLDSEKDKLLQIEVNTIACSFGGLTPILKELHVNNLKTCQLSFSEENFPSKNSCKELAKGLWKGLELYENKNAAILFLVENQTCNLSDQKQIEFMLKKMDSKINVIRRSFLELEGNLILNENRLLFVDKIEIGVVYYRTGYSPSQYSETVIEQRTLIEKSKAIKCPSIQYHLAGVKKIQQILTDKEILSKFCSNKKNLDILHSTFANIFSLTLNESGDQAYEEALKNSHKYVLKPQREGGGNNFYGDDIKNVLKPIRNSTQRNAFILMDLINSKKNQNYIIGPNYNLKNSNFKPHNLVSELGIFGVILGDEKNIKLNYEAGCLLRSMSDKSKEVGIAAGFGALDSIFLY